MLKLSLLELDLDFGVTVKVTLSVSKLMEANTIGMNPNSRYSGIWSRGVWMAVKKFKVLIP